MNTKDLRKLMEDLNFHSKRIEATICNDLSMVCDKCPFNRGETCPAIEIHNVVLILADELLKREGRNAKRREIK